MKLNKRLQRLELLVDRALTAMYIAIVVLLALLVVNSTDFLHWWTA